jgi:DNA polymerase III subunit alpha
LGIPFIAANDVHYLERRDAVTHEILLCIRTKTTMTDQNRYRFSSDHHYFKSQKEMAKLFPDLPEALSNTVDIAKRCSVSIKSEPQIPVAAIPKGYPGSDHFLKALARKGLDEKYPQVTESLAERLEYELNVICDSGYADYILMARDFITTAKRMGIMTGTRGAMAGSLVAYVTGITNIDPIKFNLLFERFINTERLRLPDIDLDFADHERYRMVDYAMARYGRNSVCETASIVRIKTRTAVEKTARVLGIAPAKARRFAGMLCGMNIRDSFEVNEKLKQAVQADTRLQELFRHAAVIERLARKAGLQGTGIVIVPDDVVNHAPLFMIPGIDRAITQFDEYNTETTGLLNIDFYGKRELSILQEMLRLIRKNHNIEIDLWKIPLDDPKTLELFGRGETAGVFLFDTQGMQEYLRQLAPVTLNDLGALFALYRPGPMDTIETYILCRTGRQKAKYPHPSLADILGPTFGVIVFQEQVMRIAQRTGGFTLGEADVFRKALGKRKADQIKEVQRKFMSGAIGLGFEKNTASAIFDHLRNHACWCFNQSHATLYAHVAYQCGFFKAHYPAEFLTAWRNTWLDNKHEIKKIIKEALRLGITLEPVVSDLKRED